LGDGAVRFEEGTWRVFLLIIAFSIAIEAAPDLLEWRVGPSNLYHGGSGEIEASDDEKVLLVMYELGAGDTIYYEYETSETCWFVIYTIDRTDPQDINIDERLNLSGTQNSGSFDCPVDGQYYLRVIFLGDLPEGMATIEYYTHALNDSSILKMVTETAILAVLAAILLYFAYSAYRWGYGGRLYKGLGAAGGIIATPLSCISYLRPTVFNGEVPFMILSWSPSILLTLCFWVGLFTIAWEEEGEAVIRIGGISLPLLKTVAVVTAILLACSTFVMIYAFNYVG
jgi:hypothetical protein